MLFTRQGRISCCVWAVALQGHIVMAEVTSRGESGHVSENGRYGLEGIGTRTVIAFGFFFPILVQLHASFFLSFLSRMKYFFVEILVF